MLDEEADEDWKGWTFTMILKAAIWARWWWWSFHQIYDFERRQREVLVQSGFHQPKCSRAPSAAVPCNWWPARWWPGQSGFTQPSLANALSLAMQLVVKLARVASIFAASRCLASEGKLVHLEHSWLGCALEHLGQCTYMCTSWLPDQMISFI